MDLTTGQVQIEWSPEWRVYNNAELAHNASSIGPLASVGMNLLRNRTLATITNHPPAEYYDGKLLSMWGVCLYSAYE